MSPSPASRLFLTGFMGCGKSTVAPHLARLLGYRCVDIDDRIERAAGKTVAEIFRSEGEGRFRELERAVLRETAGMEHAVVSLGGGTLAFGGNDAFVRSAGVLIYLRVDFGTLFARLRDKKDRPLLPGEGGRGASPEELKLAMGRLFAEREPYYRQADVVVEAGDRRPEALAQIIASALEARAGSPARRTS